LATALSALTGGQSGAAKAPIYAYTARRKIRAVGQKIKTSKAFKS
jgi:hypothetical protein